MKKFKNTSKGFTLIEMLIIIFIITVISTMLVVNWRKNEEKYKLQRAAQEIIQNIRKTQTMALEGKEYSTGLIPNDSYGVCFGSCHKSDRAHFYLIFADVNRNDTYQPSDDKVVDLDVPTADGVEIYALSSNNSDLNITFSVPDGFVTIKPTASTATISIRRIGKTCPQNCKDIVINKAGQITIQ